MMSGQQLRTPLWWLGPLGPDARHPMLGAIAFSCLLIGGGYGLGWLTRPDPVVQRAAFMHQCADSGFTPTQCAFLWSRS